MWLPYAQFEYNGQAISTKEATMAARPFRLTLSLHDELRDAVANAARRQYTRPSEWVRRAIANELERIGATATEHKSVRRERPASTTF
jgi:hypothetical protein